jgi:SAM-dependent methyltransferase
MMVEWGRKNFVISNQIASIYDLPENLKGPYDVVTCWDVIKHLPDPLTALKQLWEVLKPGGYLFISTPDLSSLAARVMGQYWYYLDPIQHITLFGKDTLRKTLASTGFEVVDTCSFGHYYRMRYIFDRLLYFHQTGPLRRCILLGKKLFGFSLNWTMYLQLFDVMGIVAIKQKNSKIQ